MFTTIRNQGGLGFHIVNGVNHIVVVSTADHQIKIIGTDKIFNLMNLASGIDQGNAFGQSTDLGLSNGTAQGLNLAIDIRFGDVIKIN